MQTAPQVNEILMEAVLTKPRNNFKDIRKLAIELLVKHENDWDAAADEAVEIILSNPKEWKHLTTALVERSIKDIVKNVGSQIRSQVVNEKIEETEEEFEYENRDEAFCRAKANSVPTLERGISGETLIKIDVLGQAEATISTYKAMRMNKCKKNLEKCTKEDLKIEIEMFTDKAMENDKKREPLYFIYNNLEEGQTVGERFSEGELKKIWQETSIVVEDRWSKYRA